MKEPGLDDRHRDRDGEIDLKHGNTQNRHLSVPIPQYKPMVKRESAFRSPGKGTVRCFRTLMDGNIVVFIWVSARFS